MQQEHSLLARNRAKARGNLFRKHWEYGCQKSSARRQRGKKHVSEDGFEGRRVLYLLGIHETFACLLVWFSKTTLLALLGAA